MSSTERAAALIRQLHEEIAQLAARLAAEGRSPFPLGPDPRAGSYYAERQKTAMEPADFELSGAGSPAELAPALVELWQGQGWPELAPLAPAIAEIARALQEGEDGGGADGDGEVSPFVYAMY